ncbi:MAG: pyridoxal phosphate-dependent aminotransferase [archaeon]
MKRALKSALKGTLKEKRADFIEKEFSKRSFYLPKTDFPRIMRLTEEAKGIISLGPGEPDFAAPKKVRDFTKKCLDRGLTHYSPTQGRTDLREEISRKLARENKIRCGQENVIVTSGSIQGLAFGIMSLIDPGEGVVIPNPGFLSYAPAVEALNGFPQFYRLEAENGFQLDPDRIKKEIDSKTRAIIINSPSNPTGVVYRRSLLEEIADIAIENELMVISDEAYEKLVYGKARHFSMASLNGMHENVLSLYSFSKSYAMPGFRVGYGVGPEWLIKSMTHLQHNFAICAPTLGQLAGLEALKKCSEDTERMRLEYDRRRKMIVKRIAEMEGLELEKEPEGAFYVFPRFNTRHRMNSRQFFEAMLKKAKVAVVPGTEFGSRGEGFVRMSYSAEYGKIEVALDRMERAIKGL